MSEIGGHRLKPGRRERSRRNLLDAAFLLLSERGFEGTTAADVSQAADLAVGTFYNHFPHKAALKDEVVALAAAGHRHLIEWATASAADPAARVALAVKASVLRAARLPPWAAFVGRFGLSEPELLAVLGHGADDFRSASIQSEHAVAAVAGLVVAFSALAAQSGSDGIAEADSAALAALRAMGVEGPAAIDAARLSLPA